MMNCAQLPAMPASMPVACGGGGAHEGPCSQRSARRGSTRKLGRRAAALVCHHRWQRAGGLASRLAGTRPGARAGATRRFPHPPTTPTPRHLQAVVERIPRANQAAANQQHVLAAVTEFGVALRGGAGRAGRVGGGPRVLQAAHGGSGAWAGTRAVRSRQVCRHHLLPNDAQCGSQCVLATSACPPCSPWPRRRPAAPPEAPPPPPAAGRSQAAAPAAAPLCGSRRRCCTGLEPPGGRRGPLGAGPGRLRRQGRRRGGLLPVLRSLSGNARAGGGQGLASNWAWGCGSARGLPASQSCVQRDRDTIRVPPGPQAEQPACMGCVRGFTGTTACRLRRSADPPLPSAAPVAGHAQAPRSQKPRRQCPLRQPPPSQPHPPGSSSYGSSAGRRVRGARRHRRQAGQRCRACPHAGCPAASGATAGGAAARSGGARPPPADLRARGAGRDQRHL